MKRRQWLWLLLLVFVVGCSGGHTPPSAGFSVQGVLLDWDQVPLPGVSLLYGASVSETSAEGRWHIANLSAPTEIIPQHPDYWFFPPSVVVSSKNDTVWFVGVPRIKEGEVTLIRPNHPIITSCDSYIGIEQAIVSDGAWIRVTPSDLSPPFAKVLGPVLSMEYEGLHFQEDVLLDFPLWDPTTTHAMIFRYDPQRGDFEALPSTIQSGRIQAKARELSVFGVFEGDMQVIEHHPLILVECGLFHGYIRLSLPEPHTFVLGIEPASILLTHGFSELTITDLSITRDKRHLTLTLSGSLVVPDGYPLYYGRILLPRTHSSYDSILLADIDILPDVFTQISIVPEAVFAHPNFFQEFALGLFKPEPFTEQVSQFTDLRIEDIHLSQDFSSLQKRVRTEGDTTYLILEGNLQKNLGIGTLEILPSGWSGFRTLARSVEILEEQASLSLEPATFFESRTFEHTFILTMESEGAFFLPHLAPHHIGLQGPIETLQITHVRVAEDFRQAFVTLAGSVESTMDVAYLIVKAEGHSGNSDLRVPCYVLMDLVTDLVVTPLIIQPSPSYDQVLLLELITLPTTFLTMDPHFLDLQPERILLEEDFASLELVEVLREGYPENQAGVRLVGDLMDVYGRGVLRLLDGAWNGWVLLHGAVEIFDQNRVLVTPKEVVESPCFSDFFVLTLDQEGEFDPQLDVSQLTLGGAFSALELLFAYRDFDDPKKAFVAIQGPLKHQALEPRSFGTIGIHATAWSGDLPLRALVEVLDSKDKVELVVSPKTVHTRRDIEETLLLILKPLEGFVLNPTFKWGLSYEDVVLGGALQNVDIHEIFLDPANPRNAILRLRGMLTEEDIGYISLKESAWCGYYPLESAVYVERERERTILIASADATVDSLNPHDTLGASEQLLVVDYPYYPPGTRYFNYSYLHFDLDGFPHTQIHRAFLRLFTAFGPDGDDGMLAVYPVLQPWEEPTITFRNRPLLDPGFVAAQSYQGGPAVLEFDITELVRQYLTGARPNYGVAIMQSETFVGEKWLFAGFHSREAPFLQPQLVILH